MILVDSTRSGKRIPDALSKTIPIWCAVINRAQKRRDPLSIADWDIALYTPPHSVSKQEHAQIETLLDQWADSLLVQPLTASMLMLLTLYSTDVIIHCSSACTTASTNMDHASDLHVPVDIIRHGILSNCMHFRV